MTGGRRPALGQAIYGAAAWGVMGLVGIPCWLLVLCLPKLAWRWRVTWAAVRSLSGILRIPIKVVGEQPAPGKPAVIVANHQSILDSFALFGPFSDPVVFVAGGDLATHPIAGPFLRGLGAVFVRVEEGVDRSTVRAVLTELADLARGGARVVFFPEGGLSPEPGLRRFQLGAFVVAGEAQCPVIPVAVSGTRTVLAPGARLPRGGKVAVRFGEALAPPEPGWRAAHEVARQARAAIEALLADAQQ